MRAPGVFSIASAPESHAICDVATKEHNEQDSIAGFDEARPCEGTTKAAGPVGTLYLPQPSGLTQDEIRQIVLDLIG